MALSSRLKLWEQKIKEEKKPAPTTQPPPPISMVPGGFLKQLVRETEKETRQKEPENKEEKAPSKLSDNLVQHFLLPDETPPILEAEMSLRSEQLVNGENGHHTAQSEKKTSLRRILTPDSKSQKVDCLGSNPQEVSGHKPEQDSGVEGSRDLAESPGASGVKEKLKEQPRAPQEVKTQEVKQEKVKEVRQDPEGQQDKNTVGEQPRKPVKDVWYEAGTVWYTHKNGFALATQLNPDEGTPELPDGKVRIRLHADGSVHDVTQYEIEKVNPSELDLCEDLSDLVSVNEPSVLHTLMTRANARMPLTQAGPNLLTLWPPLAPPGKSLRARRSDAWEAPATLQVLVRRVYTSMVAQRRDQCVVAVGRSGAGKSTSCQAFAQELLKQAGTAGGHLSVERLQAVFTVLRSFGGVSSPHSDASTRFAMVLSLDFNHKGLVAAAQLQTLMLERWRVCRRPAGESNFLIFSQMLAGLSLEMRSDLQLHQLPETNSFGITCPTKVDEKQRATVDFGRLLAAMNTLGFSADEQRAIWHVLAGIYHLGIAGVCKVGRKQFMSFDSAQVASAVLGCEGDDLHTAVFKHHLRQLLQRATGGTKERNMLDEQGEGPKLTAAQCVDGMASGLYEELFTAIVSLINRALCSKQLTLGSVMVVDTPGLRNPRHGGEERAAGFPELCHNYLQERLLEHCFTQTFSAALHRYAQESMDVEFEAPERSPREVVCAIDQPGLQLRGPEGDSRGLLWVLDEEIVTPGSSENVVLQRICQYFGDTVRQCEQPLQCEIAHLMGSDPIRYDLSGWFGLVQNNPSALNAISILQNSSNGAVKALFGPRASVPALCRSLGGVEGGSQRSLERSGMVRKTFCGGMAAIRRNSRCIAIKLQADALVNLIRRSQPVFLQCLTARTDGGGFDVPALRIQLQSTHLLPALQLYRIGYPEHMSLSDFRCRFQALSPPVMKRYGSVFITPNERKAVEELLTELDLDKKSIVLGTTKVFMKRGVLSSLDVQRNGLVSSWLVHMQAACLGHLARQRYRRLKVQQMAVSCIQRNVRVLTAVATWSWWKLMCKVRPLLDVNMVDHRIRAKEDEISGLRRRLEKSEKERNELRQTADNLETKVTAVVSELSDERFRGDAVSQALDTERAERLRLTKENRDLQARLDQSKTTLDALEKQLEDEKQKTTSKEALCGVTTESELQLQLECAQTEVEFVRRRLRQTEERLEAEKQARELLDAKVLELQAQLEQSKRLVTELKRQCRRATSDLQDARVLTDSLQARAHELDRKQRRFDGELTRVLEEVDNECEQKLKAIQESTALGTEVFSLRRSLKESQAEVAHLQLQKEELCAQIRDLTVPLSPSTDSVAELKRRVRELDSRESERVQEMAQMSGKIQQQEQMHLRFEMELERMKQIHQKELEDKDEELEDVQKSSQRRLRQLEMQLEQEYEEKQMVVHEKHDLEGLIATLCEQVGHRDFDVEKRLRRDLKRTHALLSDAQLLLSTMDESGPGHAPGTKEQLERLHCQLEESEARRLDMESVQKTLTMELENAQLELENICKHKSLVDEQLAHLQHEKADLLKRLEEDQDDLNELMNKHKTLIAQSSSDITQIRELQAELDEVKKERQSLQEQLQTSVDRVQFLESSTVARSIVSKQEAHVCDLENKLEFHRGQVKRFEVLVLRLRDSVVRLGEELEQSAQAEAREKENARYCQQRLTDMKQEMEDLSVREQESSRRRMELEMQVEELSAVRQTLQADLETSIRRIADLQAALEEVESSDESDTESVQTAVESFSRKKDLDSVSSVGSSVGTEDVGEGIRHWLGVPRGGRGGAGSPYSGSTTGRQSVTDTMSTYSFRSCTQELEEEAPERSGGLGRASSSTALSELLEGLRRKRAGRDRASEAGEGSTVSLPIYQTTGASALRRRASALSGGASEGPEDTGRPGILKPPSPLLPRATSLLSLSESVQTAPSVASTTSKMNRFSSWDSITSAVSSAGPRRPLPNLSIPEEGEEEPSLRTSSSSGSYLPTRRRLLGDMVAEGEEARMGAEPLIFQNRRLLTITDTAVGDASSDIVPAIRRAQSASSLAGSVSRGGQRRALSVHFGELPPSRTSRRDSDTDSSGSGGSQRRTQGERLEAEGSEGDVNAVMKKYLRKPEVD
ncbi:unconventional myosin-XVIIIb isoform X2 [Brachyhypopomus gauderio]|uniref:unconventional myosin-XVIIIb isoform X2 n=1 Tax=Brachyhypopomus gauderio TaxID=698409 RepID=UPI0040413717